ncbi:hypothetical protein [Rhodohalobacter mucosus]|uniref:Uncharacterized protein n=1 Tax=Rhodohalobacter mucosus TaxID=2079485 RepID=A0A316TMC2_9BACT|nr:hypothetical protein [Rhodohalobacter mucosus]PWN05550.1 hypothetical protein DDZ15_13165 [Rhodohalobacter mucosus]
MFDLKQILLCISAGMIVILSSCAPDPVFRLQSDDENADDHNSVMQNGMEYLISDLDQSGAVLAYYRHIGDRIVMDLEVFNYSDEVVRFAPSDVHYVARSRDFKQNANGELEWFQHVIEEGSAIDPEKTMLDIDMAASREEAQERTALLLDGISATLDLASDISDAGNLTRNELRKRENRRIRDAIYRTERRDYYYQNIASLNNQRTYWETRSLRTTDLLPDESVAGEISIPLIENATEYEVIIHIGGEKHRFRYLQREYKP